MDRVPWSLAGNSWRLSEKLVSIFAMFRYTYVIRGEHKRRRTVGEISRPYLVATSCRKKFVCDVQSDDDSARACDRTGPLRRLPINGGFHFALSFHTNKMLITFTFITKHFFIRIFSLSI